MNYQGVVQDVQGDREHDVDHEAGDGRHGERVTGPTAERRVGAATARTAEGAGEPAALWPLDQDDENQRRRDDDEEHGEDDDPSGHGQFPERDVTRMHGVEVRIEPRRCDSGRDGGPADRGELVHLEARSADQAPIHVGGGEEFRGIRGLHRSAVDDSN